MLTVKAKPRVPTEMTGSAIQPGPARVKVIYIAGRGRSGSTLIDNILGQIPGFFSGGEIALGGRRLSERGICGCGQPIHECPVWQPVLLQAFGSIERATREMLTFFTVGRQLADAAALLTGGGGGFRRRHRGTVERIDALYSSIAAKTKCRVIVDSSKFPPFGLAIGLSTKVDLYVLHVVRDPRAVAYSWLRQKPAERSAIEPLHRRQFGSAASAWRWLIANGLSEWSFAGLGERYRRVRYEDFVTAPHATLASLLEWVGEEADLPASLTESRLQLEPTHAISGNPSRFNTGSVTIRLDDEWDRSMSGLDKAVVATLTWPLRRRYGYDR